MFAVLPQAPVSPRTAQLKKLAEDNKTLQARNALRTFLQQIHSLQEDMRRGAASTHPQAYQVFLSYAWADGNPRFEGLRRLLRAFHQDITEAGLAVWFDEKHMVGDISAQMEEGVASSDLVLIFGTEVYRSKTQADSKTNVKKELDCALEHHKAKPGFLIPLLLEGKAKEIFSAPGLGYSQLIVDATKWAGLDQEQYHTREYIHALTTFQNGVGILPAALGLPQADRKYQSRYETCEKALQADLEKIYAVREEKEGDHGLVPSLSPLPAAQLLAPAAAPPVSPEQERVQKALAEKEQEITAFLIEQGVSSRQELQDALDADTANLPNAKGLKLKNLNASIVVYEEALAELSKREGEREDLKKQLATLTGKAEVLPEATQGGSGNLMGDGNVYQEVVGNLEGGMHARSRPVSPLDTPLFSRKQVGSGNIMGNNNTVQKVKGNVTGGMSA